MSEEEEQCYIEGQRSAQRYIIMHLLREYRGNDGEGFEGFAEVAEARNYIRRLFEQLGCLEDYDPDGHLADCIDQLTDLCAALEQENKELRDAVEGLCWQFGHRTVIDGKPCLHSGCLSDMEYAFRLMGWDDPHFYSEAEQYQLCCEIDGCFESSSCGVHWGNEKPYLRLCSNHFLESLKGTPMPPLKAHAIERESHRGEDGILRSQKENENEH